MVFHIRGKSFLYILGGGDIGVGDVSEHLSITSFLGSWEIEKHLASADGPSCSPSYSGCRDQEDHILKPAQGNSSGDLSLKHPSPKRAGRVAQVKRVQTQVLPKKRFV
jgi:hypothetical protein